MEMKGKSKIKAPFWLIWGLLIWVGLSCAAKIDVEEEVMNENRTAVNLIHVGAVVDKLTPSIGGAAEKCIQMALTDFYAAHPYYRNRLIMHIRDSQDVVAATSAVVDLVKNQKVHAIIGPESSSEATFMIKLGEQIRVPIISFSATSLSISPSHSPFFVRTAQNDSSQVKAITTIVQGFGWHELVLIYEDTEYGKGLIPFLTDELQQSNIRVPYKYAIATSMDAYQISEQLNKMKNRQTRVFLVHVTSPFGSVLFPLVDKAGMMSEGYAWILTNSLSNCLDAMDPLVIKSMEGVLGIRPYFPASEALESFKRRWKWSKPELNIYGLWAYDTIWALATAAERIGEGNNLRFLRGQGSDVEGKTDIANLGVSEVGPKLLKEMLNIKFQGLSGNFHLVNGHLQPSAFEIFNLIGRGERLIGCWSPEKGICRNISDTKHTEKYSTSVSKLKKIIWPGDSITAPKGWAVPANGEKIRIGVPKKQGFNEFLDVTRNPQTGELNFSGFCIDVFRAVADALPFPFPYEFELSRDEAGDSSVIYDDLLHQLNESEKKFDVVVGDITIVANRANYVDFSLPFTDSGVTMLVPVKRNLHRSMWVFLKPLSLGLWLTAIAVSIATGAVLLILEHNGRSESLRPLNLLCLILWFPVSSMVLPERQIVTNTRSRFVLVVWLFLAFVLMQSYTASLSSILMSDQLQPKYFSVSELISKGYYVGYQKGSFLKSMLIEQLKFNESKLKSYANVEEYRKALSKGSQNGGVAAIFDEIPYLQVFLTKYGSDFTMAGPKYRTDGFGFAFPLNSRLVPYVSRAILNVTESEKMVAIQTKYFGVGNQNQDSSISSPNSPCLEASSFGGLFIITGISLLLALIGSKTFVWQKPASVAKTYYRKYVSFQQHLHSDVKDKVMDDRLKLPNTNTLETVSAGADHGCHDGSASPAKHVTESTS
ncbi:glutamate receptor 2.2-like [Cucurbita maxima]|uniref:Glutamate receptor n=1 Tax=Cucurbita maxima TaxID=3661 RepID=A0A6J1I3V0_CUCMA|nr:glutamate receptor 2.2-like [Cucurbita maxima]